MKGVVDVVATPRGIAVVGENMWAAMKGREAVTVEWDEAKAEEVNPTPRRDYRCGALWRDCVSPRWDCSILW